jgi:SAM-dependent methyltransferase
MKSISEDLINFYKKNLSWNTRISSLISKEHSDIDRMILQREPKLEFTSDGKINIDKMYPPSLEIRTDESPYYEYYQCIKKAFKLKTIDTFCDIGCATGHLIQILSEYNSISVAGVEYFEYQKNNAHESVKDCINVLDIRDPLDVDVKFDIVNCTEVAEHIDPKYLDVFLDNLKKITGKYLIFSWSNSYPPADAPPQHVSPLPPKDVMKIMTKWGFELNMEKTRVFNQESLKYNNYYPWWRESLTIWKVK